MRKSFLTILTAVLCVLTFQSQVYSQATTNNTVAHPGYPAGHDPSKQISQFVRRIFQDSHGNFWFGTNGDGAVRYDGNSLTYFRKENGFAGRAVRGIVEDETRNVWFGTDAGVSRYDGKTFTNYTTNDGLVGDDVWRMYIDKSGIIWVGTIDGLSRFDTASGKFVEFPVPPATELDPLRGVTSLMLVHDLMEDSNGNLWIAIGTGGVHRYDGKTFTNITEKDGLANNSVNDILEDSDGNIWFATHHGGVSRFDGKTFTNFTLDGTIDGHEVWSLYEDRSGNIWFPAEGYGVYCYDGTAFKNYYKDDGLYSNAIQCIYEDKDGRIWCGGYLGLFRMIDDRFLQVTIDGPWE